MEYRRLRTSITSMRAQEHTAAKTAKLEALVEYVAIMTDIELPMDEMNNEVPESEVV